MEGESPVYFSSYATVTAVVYPVQVYAFSPLSRSSLATARISEVSDTLQSVRNVTEIRSVAEEYSVPANEMYISPVRSVLISATLPERNAPFVTPTTRNSSES